MAVGSDKDIKKKRSSSKKKKSKKDTASELAKTKIIDIEKIKEQDDNTVNNEVVLPDTANAKNSNKKILPILLVTNLFLLLCIYMLFPKIKLIGNDEVTITYNQNYVEAGYSSKILFRDITRSVKVDNNLDTGKVGKYTIGYYLEYGIFRIKKERIVNVVDTIKPEILTEDIINICPNDEVPAVEFSANDEYDGDLTEQVIEDRLDDKIILSVSDSSNNKTIKEVIVDRDDKTAPEIKLKGSETVYLGVGASYVEAGYEATDNCDGDLTDKVEVSSNVSSAAGSYKVTYTVSDSGGNKTEVTRSVVVRNYNLYNSGSINNGTVYLTFDDGPSEGTTNIILDVLKEQGVKATFFVTCNGPDYLIKRIYDEGHTVALHTATHDYSYIYSSVDNYFNDLNRVSNRVSSITGIDSKIIRFPGGSSNTVSRRYQSGIMTTLTSMVLDRGYRYFDWNVDAMDASSARSSSDVYYNVINHLSMNRANVVLMHDTKGITRDAIRDIIKTAQSQGYSFSKIDMDTYMVRHSVNN